jgi:hypothetical protein
MVITKSGYLTGWIQLALLKFEAISLPSSGIWVSFDSNVSYGPVQTLLFCLSLRVSTDTLHFYPRSLTCSSSCDANVSMFLLGIRSIVIQTKPIKSIRVEHGCVPQLLAIPRVISVEVFD